MAKATTNKRVFVIGAGASASCGLPLTNRLLPDVLEHLDSTRLRKRIRQFIKYLYPYFHLRWANYPNLEEFLSLMDVYIEFSSKVKRSHLFTPDEVSALKNSLLRGICSYLHHKTKRIKTKETQFYALAEALRSSDVLITFNWDLLMEAALLESKLNWNYSYQDKPAVTLLKPHGSIDWFEPESHLSEAKSFPLIPGTGKIRVFSYFRAPRISSKIVPVIIPPVVSKVWKHDEFDVIWRDAWVSLRNCDEIYILGFSMPPEDLHVRFVMRSAIRANDRARGSSLKINLVNPDPQVFLRFSRLMTSRIRFFESKFENVKISALLAD